MTYDFDISDEVSLSKILDAFIIDDENPDVVISFLKQHEENLKDIFQYSLYCNRIFQLDFFLACNSASQDYIIKNIDQISKYDACLLVWQILMSRSLAAQNAKFKFRSAFKQLLENGIACKHPYSNGHKYDVSYLDELCSSLHQTTTFKAFQS